MKNWRKMGAAVLAAAVMATTAVSAGALDVTADRVVVDDDGIKYYEWGDLKYIELPDGTLEINGLADSVDIETVTEIVIPDTVNGKKVGLLTFFAIEELKNLKSITISSGISYLYVRYQNTDGDIVWSPLDEDSNLTDIYYEGTREQWNEIGVIFGPLYTGRFGGGYEVLNNEEVVLDEEFYNKTPSELVFGDVTIHFSDGTTAKTSEIGISGENPDDSKTDTEDFISNGVTVTANEGVIPEGAEFSAVLKEVTDDDFTYEFKFIKDGEKVDFDGIITVKVPIPEAFLGVTLYVYRNEADGTQTFLPSKIENGFIIFETDHFSEYLISAAELGEESNSDNDSSDDENNSDSESNSDNENNSGNESNSGNGENSGNESPDTGFAGVAMPLGVIALAGAAVAVTKKKAKK